MLGPHGDAMNGIEKLAAFYRGYLMDDRSLAPVAMVLAIGVALWLLFYLVSAVGPYSKPEAFQSSPHASYVVSGPATP